MHDDLTPDRVRAAYTQVRDELLAQRNDRGHWTGKLSTSALSTATAVMALEMVHRHSSLSTQYSALIQCGLDWLVAHQHDDGGWGDTTKSFSNISTTMLCHAVLHATRERWSTSITDAYESGIERAKTYIDNAGGVPAVIARYGKDKTFSVPILTHCALAGLVEWKDVTQLPFELACIPQRFYKTVRLPVVSYALPALIAIGQVRHYFRPTRVPGLRSLRNLAQRRSLDILQRIQPSNGGFLEAPPLTSFVTMSLAGMGLVEHPVVQQGVAFLVDSVRDDGSWPIDTNLATWVTTLSVNALGPDLPDDAREPILRWLLDQQYKEVHPYTGTAPGGWSWTDLPGGVPDADDTPGAILAILELVRSQGTGVRSQEAGGRGQRSEASSESISSGGCGDSEEQRLRIRGGPKSLSDDLIREAHEAVRQGVKWLLDLQNHDGGWPTFCRGWGKLPFDRSSPDITAHSLRAINSATGSQYSRQNARSTFSMVSLDEQTIKAIGNGWDFLNHSLDSASEWDGSWNPLWFGNQHVLQDANPTYGTSRVIVALDEILGVNVGVQSGLAWLARNQNDDGGWGGGPASPSSVEETSLALQAMLARPYWGKSTRRGLLWLIERVENGTYTEPTPIGFYFAKLWYFESLYPLIFTVAALRRACEVMTDETLS